MERTRTPFSNQPYFFFKLLNDALTFCFSLDFYLICLPKWQLAMFRIVLYEFQFSICNFILFLFLFFGV